VRGILARGRKIPRRSDDDAADSNRRQIRLRAAGPVVVFNLDGIQLRRLDTVERSHGGSGGITRCRAAEMRGPPRRCAERVLVDGDEIEVGEQGDQAVAGQGGGGWVKSKNQRG
jgi:hypothetical protein